MVGNRKPRWIISFSRNNSVSKHHPTNPPDEFLCPITNSLMVEPVVDQSGQTFERVAVQVCIDLGFNPILDDGTRPDFNALIPNKALRQTIINWCNKSDTKFPDAPDYYSVNKLVRTKMEAQREPEPEPEPQPPPPVPERREVRVSSEIRVSERELLNGVENNRPVIFSLAVSEVAEKADHFRFDSGSSEESVIVTNSPETPIPLPLMTRPSCYSSFSSSEVVEDEQQALCQSVQTLTLNPEEEELISKMTSPELFEQEQGVIMLRKITRTRPESRGELCTGRMIAAIKPLLNSRYGTVQVNAVAAMVNLTLESSNKVKIVRSGVVPLLIDVLKGGFCESEEHAAGALFSLALEDDNKMAIGVLGALPPLLHALRSDSERTRHDSALALYNLTLVQSNRIKMVKLNAIPTLLAMVKARNLVGRALLILCNLAACTEGRAAMLDGNAVGILVELLRNGVDSESTRENCVATLFALSHGSLRFKGLARDVKLIEVLREIEEKGTQRAREKAKRLLEIMKGRDSREEEDQDRVFPLESGGIAVRARHRAAGICPPGMHSSEF